MLDMEINSEVITNMIVWICIRKRAWLQFLKMAI